LTPGWSRAIWPDETPRIATWLCPGPRFWTLNPATLRATPSMSSMPRDRSWSSVSAAMETGVFCTVSSRFIAVTVTSSSRLVWRVKSALTVAPGSTFTPGLVSFPKPLSAAATEYVPGRTSAE
jgi:hypothetical protein